MPAIIVKMHKINNNNIHTVMSAIKLMVKSLSYAVVYLAMFCYYHHTDIIY